MLETTNTSKSFEVYWKRTACNRQGYPKELIALIRKHALVTWRSAIQSAGNRVTVALYGGYGREPQCTKKIAHDTIWEMIERKQDE